MRPSGGQRHIVAMFSLWSLPFRGSVRQPPVSLRRARAGGEAPWLPAICTPPEGLAHLARGTVSAPAARRPCSVRPRAPGRGRAKGGCKDGAEWARAATCSVARGPTFPREPALGSLTWGVPVAGAGGARQVCDGGGGSGERRLDGLAEGPQAARPGPAPRSRPL